MRSTPVIRLFWHQRENIFTDNEGHLVYDLFKIITPQDLVLFKHDPGNNCFPIVGDPDILCEIVVEDGEDCGSPDLGDDYERVDRLLSMYNNLAYLGEEINYMVIKSTIQNTACMRV